MKKFFAIAITAAMMILCSCASKNNVNMEGQWVITNACGVSTVGGDSEAFIEFDGKGNINGNATVNTFFGSYSTKGDSLTFGTMGMTLMLGQSMEMETAITKALNSTATVKVENDEATIFNKNGESVMTLKRKK